MSIPTQLGPYRIDRWLGGGGFADVYLAFDARRGHQVALKVLKPEHAHGPGLKRFRREGEQMLRLRHQPATDTLVPPTNTPPTDTPEPPTKTPLPIVTKSANP